MKEILFLYHNHRCHARIVEERPEEATDKRYIGNIDGYNIYSLGILFDQFGFIAIKED